MSARTLSRYLRPRQVCRRLGISRQTLWRMSKDGRLPAAIKLGPGIAVYDEEALLAAVEKMRGEGTGNGDGDESGS